MRFRYLKLIISMCLCFSLAFGGFALNGLSAAKSKEDVPVSIVNWEEELQNVDGFGGAFAFHKAGSIMRLKEPVRTQILDMIFNQDNGIGLSIVRTMVGDGGTWGNAHYDGPTDTIMPAPGKFVWDDPEWETKKDEFDKYQIWLMKEAQKRGVKTFFSSVWSAPAWMKENNSVIQTNNGLPNKLRRDMYDDFANYLADYVLGYKEHFGIDIGYISPANEPDHSGGYSSSLWTAEELNIFVRDYLGPVFEERNVPAKIVLGEGIGFSEKFVLDALNDPNTVDYVDVVAAHGYTGLQNGDTTPDPEEFQVSKSIGKTIWQTEYMNQGNDKQRFQDNIITDAMKYANLIGNMYTVTGISAYFWWWPAANNGADGSDLIRLVNDGSNQGVAATENGLFRVFKRYYSFGNYSRFIQPGYVMIGAEKHPVDDVMVTAFKDPETGNFTIVAVNNSSETRKISFKLNDFPDGTNAVVPYRTSASENLKKLDEIKVEDGAFTMELRGSSVTSFIPKSFELPALPDMKDVFSTYLAEENDGQSPGLQASEDAGGNKVLTNIRNGTFVKYSNVNFADGTANGQAHKRGVLSMNAHVASINGGTIEVRLDNPHSGKVVGEMEIPKVNDPNRWFKVSTMIDTNSIDGAYGFHDLYLVFKGDNSSNIKMFNVDYFEFNDGNLEPPINVTGNK
ncbi:glycoside hydrolase [Bacillus sp. J33]|uniref:glycoside hydrolase n=1 Tax=Bacillus sp. J33 TaxID=935836 RepID=UPI0004BC5FCB|nr:glycoside hydrolase [Bacillus sp. J33]